MSPNEGSPRGSVPFHRAILELTKGFASFVLTIDSLEVVPIHHYGFAVKSQVTFEFLEAAAGC